MFCFLSFHMFRFIASSYINVTLDFVLSNFLLHAVVITFVIQGLVE